MFKQPRKDNSLIQNLSKLRKINKLTRTLNVHEVRVGRLHKSLELVRALLVFNGRVKKIDGQLIIIRF